MGCGRTWGQLLALVVGLFGVVGAAEAQQIKPRFLIIADNSGSMEQSNLGATTCAGYGTNKMAHAKCAIRNILDSAGDAEFGLMRFAVADNSLFNSGDCSASCSDRYRGGDLDGNNCGGDLVVPISSDNEDARAWVDDVCSADCSGGWETAQMELYAATYTPLYESLIEARDYFAGTISGVDAPTLYDAAADCRPLNVILLTDGEQGGCANEDPEDGAAALRNLSVPSPNGNIVKDIRTHVIGFGVSNPTADIENIATQGGTTSYYADDQETLSAALQQIIFDAQLNETCDGQDNDCDGAVDEFLDLWCDGLGLRGSASQSQLSVRYTSEGLGGGEPALGAPETNRWLCDEPGEACNQVDDDCDGIVDEDASGGMEICNTQDDDCDGIIDEGLSCSCAPSESCNGINDDCDDGTLDTDLTRPCGTDEGVCMTGTESCQDLGGGMWGYTGCDAYDGEPSEDCNNLDDDCDGIIDSYTEACGSSSVGECALGQRLCTAGAWGACVGEVGPGSEICDGLDNDCDGMVDEATDVDMNDSRVGVGCGTSQGTCAPGDTICMGGGIVCYGEDFGDGAEVCDGEDDDCDGLTDEGNPDGGAQCGVSDVGDCQYGAEQCIGGTLVCVGNVDPGERAETCDDVDNDCDSTVDEGLSRVCGTDEGVCSTGTQSCSGGLWGMCSADVDGDAETCDGQDDDCDGKVDEQVTDAGGACGDGDGECSQGVEICVAGALVCTGDIGPTAETCDNLDNDCDGSIDEDVPLQVCGTTLGECDLGTQACSAGGWSACSEDPSGSAETCDGLDNDCDGAFDEGTLPGVGGTCGGTQGECTPGTSACVAGAIVCQGEGEASAETCDDLDNDCDGMTDEGVSRACGTAIGLCTVGVEVCSAGSFGGCDGVPSAAELCDGLDNDCDGLADEGNPESGSSCESDIGACTPGVEACVGGALVCTGFVGPSEESCDTLDNDCDGQVDEFLQRACGTAVGECSVGVQACGLGTWGSCDGMGGVAELCDALDNDCDGSTDEGNPGSGGSCGMTDVGTCELGAFSCVGGSPTCVGAIDPVAESCDGLDNDCDGSIDEGVTRNCGVDVGECSIGVNVCSNGSWGPCSEDEDGAAELCDGLDNDCDGLSDEGNPESGGSCESDVGECAPGTLECLGGALACTDFVGPELEQCDGLDNDCDGTTDEGLSRACGTDDGTCVVGTEQCSAGAWAGCDAVQPVAELCDGLDNDCDGLSDEGNPESGTACGQTGVGECSLGALVCLSGSLSCRDEVGPGTERCDDLDNDCDGMTDEGLSRACGSQVGECTVGTQACSAGAWGLCDGQVAAIELCDGLDNDCDARIDEGNPGGGQQCGDNDTGECTYGTTRCVGGNLACEGEVDPAAETCDTLDNDCDGVVDEADPLIDTPCGSDVGECTRGLTKCVAGALLCQGGQTPVPELCDGLNNDCDERVDEGNPEGGGFCGDVGSCRRSADPEDLNAPLDQPCGRCRFGREQCVDGALSCIGTVSPQVELCDGVDNDCDYPCAVDEDGRPTGACPADPCELPPGDPNYIDCDARIDEGVMDTDPNVGVPCGVDIGECTAGAQTCIDGELVCEGGMGAEVEVCDGLDNDCDGNPDDGIPVDEPCGNDVGECQTGLFACNVGAGQLECVGSTDPADEVCDGLDNDCDGRTDEALPLGAPCGSDEGECSMGTLSCRNGQEVCTDAVTPAVEVCDCADNDCDGEIDEGAEDQRCPGGGACVMCQCAASCRDLGEFGFECPEGKAAVDVEGSCYCVGQECDPGACANETVEVGGEVKCAPEREDVSACVCKQNECTNVCRGVVCDGGQVCDPGDGRCKAQSCLLPQFACGDGTFCNPLTGGCEDDPCATAGCDADQACRDGICLGSCADVTCDDGERCVDGTCEADACAGVSCDGGEVCNPDGGTCVTAGACVSSGCPDGNVCQPVDGVCVPDPCLRQTCPSGQVCRDANCEPRCSDGLVDCNEVCIDPQRSLKYCGASGDCTGDGAGRACEAGLVCSAGTCTDSCGDGEVQCDGRCVDPMTDAAYCGAAGSCAGAEAGSRCADGVACVDGACERAAGGNGGGTTNVPDASGSAGDDAEHSYFTATGGGGCACRVGAPASGGGPSRGPWALGLLFAAVLLRRRRVRVALRRALPAMAVALLLASSLWLGGCKTDAFCIDCVETDAGRQPVSSGGRGFGDGRQDGGTGGSGGGDGDGDGPRDAGAGGRDGGDGPVCLDHELCNELDDDCDGTVDEDPELDGVDVMTDSRNCGACGNACALPAAFPACAAGACVVESCDIGFLDLDGDADNGCEYKCSKTAEDDTSCDLRDNDCDGEIDEDIDFQSDADNCGACFFRCSFPHAEQGGACDAGVCVLDSDACDEDFHDVDGSDADGCEYRCEPSEDGLDVCNARDDDCDGEIDEAADVDAHDGRVGAACGNDVGECVAGINICTGGAIVCEGSVSVSTELCDGLDNDCDDVIDESDPDIGLACGSGIGQCVRGNLQCMDDGNGNKALACTGAIPPIDELCDGLDNDCDGNLDEGNPEGGLSCGLEVGQQQGTCAPGTGVCSGGVLTCPGLIGPGDELCDGLDNDCDGMTDEGNPEAGGSCGSGIGECEQGILLCSDGALVCDGSTLPVAETCNGFDDDCDGVIDNGVEQSDGAIGVACAGDQDAQDTGECAFGLTICESGTVQCDGYVGPALETCDTLDNDCDGSADESDPRDGEDCGVARGTCEFGGLTCQGGSMVCTGGVGPVAEVCDGLDNDCNGAVDDGALPDDDRVGVDCAVDQVAQDVGECTFGTSVCAGGQIQCSGYRGPGAELCDGLDNDCDGEIDETDPRLGTGCGSSVGACTQGGYVCDAGSLVCQGGTQAVAELCNGDDDDCDGRVDEGVGGTDPAIGVSCAGDQVAQDRGECAFGTTVCSAGSVQCSGYVGPKAETCDTLDNDCDGTADESYPEDGAACGSDIGLCQQGGLVCVAGTLECQGNVTPTDELCDNQDNDCDGLLDEGASMTDSRVGTSCFTDPAEDTGECSLGALVCSGGALQCAGYVGPAQELCDGLDNDCDGGADEGAAGVGATCGSAIGVCQTGSMQCTGGVLSCAGDVGPEGDELCDGEDDDCDGLVDEGVGVTDPAVAAVCYDDPMVQDTGECTAGTTVCVGGGVQCSGSDGPGTEACNGLDDDCDGSVDEGNPDGGAACGRDTGECVTGILTCMGGTLQCPDDVEPVAEVCDGLDNDCDGLADDAVDPGDDSSIGQSCGDPDGQCGLQPGITICLGGMAVCAGDRQPVAELCDNLDNDCDGSVDEGNPGGGQACGQGAGECDFGLRTCSAGSYSCVGDVGPSDEVCDGLDQDCDGSVDEAIDPLDDPAIGQSCGDPDGICGLSPGTTACVGGSPQCQGQQLPELEVCDGADNDCDGSVDESADLAFNDERVGSACGQDQGACSFGANICNGGAIQCSGGVGPQGETCNSTDDDCDGNIDEAIDPLDDPTIGQPCGDGTGECVQGTTVCSAGVPACNGYMGPSLEVCDSADNDCDGSSDEDFDTSSDVNHCGGCNMPCPGIDNAIVECVGGGCGIKRCVPGYTDKDDPNTTSDDADDCDYMCTDSGGETCDGIDQDCDWLVDEGLNVSPPSGFCNPNGVCAGGTVSCDGGAWTCSIQPGAEVCDYIDNDCDGKTDEGFAAIGDECRSSPNQPLSACTQTGTIRCDPLDDTAQPSCRLPDDTPVTDDAGAAVAEMCNGIDDDCDGLSDEPCASPATDSESGVGDGTGTDSCVDDAWALLPSGDYIFAYEASRPGATNSSLGSYTTRACSTSNVMPWTNVTYSEAEAACQAIGADLCTEATWYEACANGDDVGVDYCEWSHTAGDCASYSDEDCNGADNDSDRATPADDDAVLPTAYIEDTGLVSSACYRDHGGDLVYDMSGNVKEWTKERSPGGVRPLRGGAMNNTAYGISCGFDFTVVDAPTMGEPEPYFFNIGFRCCYY